jgi:hypothetical protein
MGSQKEELKKEKLQDDMRRDLVTCTFCNFQQCLCGKSTCFNCGKQLPKVN